MFTVPPQSPVIYTKDKNLAKNLQPFDEDSELTLVCEVTGGSPLPKVTWHWNDKIIDNTFQHIHDITVNRLNITKVTRNLLNAQFTCKSSNTNLIPPITAEIIVDVNRMC